MNTALVCIAKNEDHYIDEWISYHLKLGFDNIFVYQNNWRYIGDKQKYGDRVEWIDFDGEAMQLHAYNDFIDNKRTGFDFAAFFDCDEFLCLPLNLTVQAFFNKFSDFNGLCVNWRLFGDSGLTFDGIEYSVLKRFTLCQRQLNRHIKTILNVKRSGASAHFVNPHFVDMALTKDFIIDAAMTRFVHGPWNDNPSDCGIYLNHYFCKTKHEYIAKIKRGKADTPSWHPLYIRKENEFDMHNFNEIEDKTALTVFNQNIQEENL